MVLLKPPPLDNVVAGPLPSDIEPRPEDIPPTPLPNPKYYSKTFLSVV